MSLQVGSLCYATPAAAAGAACASVIPTTSIVPGTAKIVTLSCAGVSGDAMVMQTATVTPAGPASSSPQWHITASSNGLYIGQTGQYGDTFCATRAGLVAAPDQTCVQSGISARVVDNAGDTYDFAHDGGTDSAQAVTATTTYQVTPAFAPCVWDDYVVAGEAVFVALLLAWVGWYGVKKINDQVNAYRGNHD